ncbi:hypothetical protein [Caballeronia terrestris]|uniref:hypothetical protein n=1 Tax=Caballeronia terrestris TaxID=1226301 RepID=UPI000ADFE27D|nr:hypothetical protein [Caballeronia terrestris]
MTIIEVPIFSSRKRPQRLKPFLLDWLVTGRIVPADPSLRSPGRRDINPARRTDSSV